MKRLSIDELKKLQQKKYRQQYGCFLAEGEHLALELEKAALSNQALTDSELYVTEAWQHWPTVFNKHVVSEKVMRQLSDTKAPQGIVACVPMQALLSRPASKSGMRGIYLYETQDPGNLGTILRTLAWFGGFTCLLSPGCVDPFNPKVVRASMGAIFHVALEQEVALESLASRYRHIGSLDMTGATLSSREFQQAQCLVFGNEARGLPRDALDGIGAQMFTIPGSGSIESLNLAGVVNICAYELNRA